MRGFLVCASMRQKSWNRPSSKSSPFSRLRMSFAALLTLLMVAGTVSVAGAGSSAGSGLYRHQIYQGSIGGGQSTNSLAVADQSGNNDSWSKYVEFEPDGSRHDSRFNFSIPEVADSQWIEIGINYRGPEYNENRWKLAVRNVRTNSWETVFTNRDVPNWRWSDTTIELDPPEDYRRSDGRVRLRWFSSNDNDVSQLDLLTVSVFTDTDPDPSGDWTLPPAGAGFDYQIGGDYSLPGGVSVVSRDWFEGSAASGAYNICYVNAFQTQPDESGVNRPDEKSNWPQNLLLNALGDDPNWGGEYLVDLSSSSNRNQAASHIAGMVSTCASKGFDAVEFDNLDSWTRFDGTPLENQVPFGKAEAVAYAELITNHAHGLGMAVAQKNTPQLGSNNSLNVVGFDFAIAEECGRYSECGSYSSVFGNQVIAIEYNSSGLNRACSAIGSMSSVVRRDVNVSRPGESGYRFETC